MQWLIFVGLLIIAFVLWQIYLDRQTAPSTTTVVEKNGDWWGPWYGPWWNDGGNPWWWWGRGSGGYGPNGYGPRGWWPRPHHGPYPGPPSVGPGARPAPAPIPGPSPSPSPAPPMLGPGGTQRMLGGARHQV